MGGDVDVEEVLQEELRGRLSREREVVRCRQ